MKQYMAINQWGNTYHSLTHPRKELCERIGSTNVHKMYVDGKDGKTYHTGYVIGNEWLTLYEVTPFRKEVK